MSGKETTGPVPAGRGRDQLNQLVTLLYDELKRLAARQVSREQRANTLGPTGLVHEAYLRLAAQAGMAVESRTQFFQIAAHVMRCVLVDRARARLAAKRGKNVAPLPLEVLQIGSPLRDRELVALDDALRGLEGMDPRKCQLVEQRFFGGLSVEEAAAALGISPRTAAREWLIAKAWLYAELRRSADEPADERA